MVDGWGDLPNVRGRNSTSQSSVPLSTDPSAVDCAGLIKWTQLMFNQYLLKWMSELLGLSLCNHLPQIHHEKGQGQIINK